MRRTKTSTSCPLRLVDFRLQSTARVAGEISVMMYVGCSSYKLVIALVAPTPISTFRFDDHEDIQNIKLLKFEFSVDR